MKKIMDKLKNKVKSNSSMIIFLTVIMIVGIVSGSIFVALLNEADQSMIKDYITSFINQIDKNTLNQIPSLINSLTSNLFYVIIIWLLGISIIGIPIILFMFFIKAFIIGFSLTTIVMNYKFKGILFSFFYIFPHQVLNMIIYIVLLLYSIAVSLKILKAMLKKETFDFKKIINKYSKILIFTIAGTIITSFLEIYLTPAIFKLLLPILK